MTETEISDWCVVALCIDTQFALYSRLQDLILIILFIQRIKRRLQIWKYPVLDWMVARNLKDIFALNAAIGLSEHLEDKEGKMWKIHDYPNKIMCFLDLLPMVISFGQTLEALKHWCWLLSILQDPSFFFSLNVFVNVLWCWDLISKHLELAVHIIFNHLALLRVPPIQAMPKLLGRPGPSTWDATWDASARVGGAFSCTHAPLPYCIAIGHGS